MLLTTVKPGCDLQCGGIRKLAGFTLIELIITLAIGTTLMLVAVPGFLDFQRNARLSDAVSNFLSAANTAKSNAMKQGFNTYLIPADGGTNWNVGWLVFTDKNWNQTYDASTDEVVLRHDALGSDISVTTSAGTSLAAGYLLFNGSGYPRMKNGTIANQTIVLQNTLTLRSSSIIIDAAGRVRSCKTGGC